MNKLVKIPGVSDTSGLTINSLGKFVSATRKDGLEVFFDLDDSELTKMLNEVRATAPAEQVILMVGLARGMQIANCYAKKQGLKPPVAFESIVSTYRKQIGESK